MKNPTVSIIIVNWNGKKQLETCLPALFAQTYKEIEVIIVDNNSYDDSIEFIQKNFPKIQVITCSYNSGFAEGCNIGLKKVNGKYVLLLNNDTRVTKSFLKVLIEEIEKDKSIAIVQPKIIFEESRKLQSGCAFLTNTGFLYYYGYSKDSSDPKYNMNFNIFSANGSCMLIRTEVIKTIGLFDPDYFAYFEETDFCWRVWLAGYKICYIPRSTIYHAGAQTSRLLPSTFVGYHSFKNRINSLIKNLEVANIFTILPVHFFLCEIYACISLLKGKFALFWSIQKAIGWNVKEIRKTINKRSTVQKKYRKKTDKELFPSIMKHVSISYYYYLSKDLGQYIDNEIS